MLIPKNGEGREIIPNDIQEMKVFVEANRTETTPFDIVMEGETPGDNPEEAATIIRPWANVGVTWWIEVRWSTPEPDEVLTRIQQGPPHLE